MKALPGKYVHALNVDAQCLRVIYGRVNLNIVQQCATAIEKGQNLCHILLAKCPRDRIGVKYSTTARSADI